MKGGTGLLAGLGSKRKSAAGQMAYGQAMAGQADLNLAKSKQDADFGMQQLEAEQGLRRAQANTNAAQQASDASYRAQKSGLVNNQNVFNTNMMFNKMANDKQRRMSLKQALLNQAARSFS